MDHLGHRPILPYAIMYQKLFFLLLMRVSCHMVITPPCLLSSWLEELKMTEQ